MKIGKMGDADRGVAHAEKLNDTGKRAKGAPSQDLLPLAAIRVVSAWHKPTAV
jgi:hypothetical protein